jgi:hypothetical protein
MADQIIILIKGILLTEALTHAVRYWGIFDRIRYRMTRRSEFLRELLACFECTAFWISIAVFGYLYFLDFWPITSIIICQRLATICHIGIDLMDARRAATIAKI